MKGTLSPADQLKVLARVWGNDRDGYVFLPWISGSARTAAQRRRGYHEGRSYAWPRERAAVLAHLAEHTSDDVYFTPALFNAKRRVEQHVAAERALWADLDPVDPRGLGELRPTIAWETSPGRFQGVWLTSTEKEGASWAGQENHRLTLAVGADPSGWDSTQLLRVPGRPNHKPDYHTDGPVPGELLWDNGPRYTWSDFADLPQVGAVTTEVDLLDDELLEGIDRHELWASVRLKVSHRVREYMALRQRPDGADRSEVLWEIERELADAGCSVAQVVALIRPSVWNKYAGRNDELKRLKTEAAKAIAQRPDTLEAGDGVSPLEEVAKPEGPMWLNSLVASTIPRPRWLVKDVWTRGGCGFISGAPKSYKSWQALDLAVSVATGGYFLNQPGFKAQQAPVLYLQEEDDVRLVLDRLGTILEAKRPDLYWHGQVRLYGPGGPGGGVTPGQALPSSVPASQRLYWQPPAAPVPLAVHVQEGFVASDPGWQAWLADMVATHGFGLVIIDTLGTTAGDIDTDRAGELMNRMLKPLKVIAKQYDTAVCVVHHNRKAQEGGGRGSRAGQDMLGSVALHAWVDCAVYARAKEGDVLAIEREAKLAPDLALKVRVPFMHASVRTGERALWAPELVLPDVGDQAAAAPAAKREVSSSAGKQLAWRMKALGPGPFTLDYLNDVMGKDVSGQVSGAVANGYLTQHSDGRVSRA